MANGPIGFNKKLKKKKWFKYSENFPDISFNNSRISICDISIHPTDN